MLSIWEKETFFAPQDVIIAGSGFAGLWSAYYLKKKCNKLRITIVDRGIIPTGASTRNAGFSCFGSLTELLADEQKMGTGKMLELVEMRLRGLKRIYKKFAPREIDFNNYGGYELFTEKDDSQADDLRLQAAYLNKLLKPITGNKKTFTLLNKKASSFGFCGVSHIIKNDMEGQMHPGKLTMALLNKLQCMGVTFLNGLEITGFENLNNKISLYTNHQITLSTTRFLVCTNGLANQLSPGIVTEPARGQVLVTSAIKDLKWKGTFHYDEGFYYFRNMGNKVLLGGARNKAFDEERTTTLETSAFIQNELEVFLKEVILPGEDYSIEHRWSGIMGMGKNKLPDVKEILPNVFCALNLGGMGVAIAPVVGEQVAGMLVG